MFAIIAAALLALTGGFFGHIGYLGGPVFQSFAPPPAAADRHVAIVLMSGDMGIRVGMGRRLAQLLAADGFAVVGVNSLTYFRVRRTPAEAQALVGDAIARAQRLGHGRRVVMIGQSFGADLMHVALARTGPQTRAEIAFVGLIVPEATVDYRASPSEIFSQPHPDAEALPTARTLDWAPVVCIQGEAERDSLCPEIADMPNVARVALPGGHPLRHDAGAVHAVLLANIDAALAGDSR